jgi:hypothetical protein
MTENHPISNGFIPESARVLIVGTFPQKRNTPKRKAGFSFIHPKRISSGIELITLKQMHN